MRAVALVMLWLAGSGVAVAVAWEGVSIVDSQLINPRPALQSAAPTGTPHVPPAVFDSPAESDAATADRPATAAPAEKATAATRTSSNDGDTRTEPTPTPGASAPTRSERPTAGSRTPTPQPTTRPTPTPTLSSEAPTPTRAAPTPTSPTRPVAPTATTPPAPTPRPSPSPTPDASPSSSPEPTPGPAETHTIWLIGGKTAIQFSSTSVVALWQSPNPGYTGDIEQKGDNNVRVEFESGDARSRVDAWWDDGAQWVIREDD
jgi:hypothetical protein